MSTTITSIDNSDLYFYVYDIYEIQSGKNKDTHVTLLAKTSSSPSSNVLIHIPKTVLPLYIHLSSGSIETEEQMLAFQGICNLTLYKCGLLRYSSLYHSNMNVMQAKGDDNEINNGNENQKYQKFVMYIPYPIQTLQINYNKIINELLSAREEFKSFKAQVIPSGLQFSEFVEHCLGIKGPGWILFKKEKLKKATYEEKLSKSNGMEEYIYSFNLEQLEDLIIPNLSSSSSSSSSLLLPITEPEFTISYVRHHQYISVNNLTHKQKKQLLCCSVMTTKIKLPNSLSFRSGDSQKNLINQQDILNSLQEKEIDLSFSNNKSETYHFILAENIFDKNKLSSLKYENNISSVVHSCPNQQAVVSKLIHILNEADSDIVVTYDLSLADIRHWVKDYNSVDSDLLGRISYLEYLTKIPNTQCGLGRLWFDVKIAIDEFLSTDMSLVNFQELAIRLKKPYDLEKHDKVLNWIQLLSDQNQDISFLSHVPFLFEQQIKLLHSCCLDEQILFLTKQLSCITGLKWQHIFHRNKVTRVDKLLATEFTSNKIIISNNQQQHTNDFVLSDQDIEQENDSNPDKLFYQGGLNLEPKIGMYKKNEKNQGYILLMDFKSLFPSIMQEYNLCLSNRHLWQKFLFTDLLKPTCQNYIELLEQLKQSTTHNNNNNNNSNTLSIIPYLQSQLVYIRQVVKDTIKTQSQLNNSKLVNLLETISLSFKLVANTLYGSFAYNGNVSAEKKHRFYCKPLSILIASISRTILLYTTEIVKILGPSSSPHQIIFGDTDSLMISLDHKTYSTIRDAIGGATEISNSVNSKFKYINFNLESIFQKLIIYAKKKYAGLEVTPYGSSSFIYKSLELDKRNYCPLAKNMCKYIIQQILCNTKLPQDNYNGLYAMFKDLMEGIFHRITQWKFNLSDYIIIKAENVKKRVQNDNSSNSSSSSSSSFLQPHVKVYNELCSKYHFLYSSQETIEPIPYIMCSVSDPDAGYEKDSGPSYDSDRAFHPDIVALNNLSPDFEWYYRHQFHNLINRLFQLYPNFVLTQIENILSFYENKIQTYQSQLNIQ